MSAKSEILLDDVQWFWHIMRAGPALMSLTEYQDELEVLAMHTDSDVLRAMCLKNLGRFDHLGSTVRLAKAK